MIFIKNIEPVDPVRHVGQMFAVGCNSVLQCTQEIESEISDLEQQRKELKKQPPGSTASNK